MTEHMFSHDMMREREKQLMLALLDCAGVCYDINFTRNQILGKPTQIIDGVKHDVLESIGLPQNCAYTEMVDYWAARMRQEEVAAYRDFSDTHRIMERFAAGERVIFHRFWTCDVLGNRMLAEQKVRLYQDSATGDLLGLVYMINGGEADALRRKEAELTRQYAYASNRASFLEQMSRNIPGGYHRCSTGASDGFELEYVSDSFINIVGWTREEIQTIHHGRFLTLIAP